MQPLCHSRLGLALALAGMTSLGSSGLVLGDPATHDYPTQARVEYVNECIAKSGGKLSNLYQCSCAIDRIAVSLSYEDFVEASTFAKYATLPGEGGGIFRDSKQARATAKRYRELESEAWRACGLTS